LRDRDAARSQRDRAAFVADASRFSTVTPTRTDLQSVATARRAQPNRLDGHETRTDLHSTANARSSRITPDLRIDRKRARPHAETRTHLHSTRTDSRSSSGAHTFGSKVDARGIITTSPALRCDTIPALLWRRTIAASASDRPIAVSRPTRRNSAAHRRTCRPTQNDRPA
jgi:hypothetical protein